MRLPFFVSMSRVTPTRLARAVLGVGVAAAGIALLGRLVALPSIFALRPTDPQGLAAWGLESMTLTLVCYLFTSLGATTCGALLGGLTATRGSNAKRAEWYHGATRRGLELTGALPGVLFTAIWLNSHPGQALPALILVTSIQQTFEVGARLKSIVESGKEIWTEVWSEFGRSAAQVAITLASGEIALIALKLSAPYYSTWPASLASYLVAGQVLPPSLFIISLAGTLGLPACLFLAGPRQSQ